MIWRAWGILLILFSQDLGPPFTSDTDEISIRPPAGWSRRVAPGSIFARFTPPEIEPPEGGRVPPWGITLAHIRYLAKPTPLDLWIKQGKDAIAKEYKNFKMLEEKQVKIGGRAGYQFVLEYDKIFLIRTILLRSNVECYLLDASFLKTDADKYRKAAEASFDTFQIVPSTPSADELAGEARTAELLKSSKVQPGLLGEHWFSIYSTIVESRIQKIGHMRTKLSESAGRYDFEIDVRNDFGEGNVDSTSVRGSFSPDARVQKVETENTKTNDKKERWHYRSSVAIEGGRLKAARDMNGSKEEKNLPVEDGVLLLDVAEFVRRTLATAPKGIYLLKTISPYADEWSPEKVEVNPTEHLEIDGKRREAMVFFSRQYRRNMTYFFAPDGALLRQGGLNDAFSIRATTKEEALAPGPGK